MTPSEALTERNSIHGKTIAVWFSCGAASAVAAKKTLDLYRDTSNVIIFNNPIEEEDEDNQRFLKDVEKWLGHPITHARSEKYPSQSCVEVWDHRKFMSGPAGAPCTLLLKKKVRERIEREVKIDWHVLGFTLEEKKRHERFSLLERENTLPILIDAGITKAMCYKIIQDAGLTLPRVYSMGYPNANCIGCVKATSPTYWNHVRKVHPEVFKQREEQSRRIGARLARYKGKRVFLDELPPDAKGRAMKNMDIECGIFCAWEKEAK